MNSPEFRFQGMSRETVPAGLRTALKELLGIHHLDIWISDFTATRQSRVASQTLWTQFRGRLLDAEAGCRKLRACHRKRCCV